MSKTGVANMGATFLRAVALFTLALSFSGYRVQGWCLVCIKAMRIWCRRCGYGAGGVGSSEGRARRGTRDSLALTFSWPESATPPGSWEGASGRVPRKEQMKA